MHDTLIVAHRGDVRIAPESTIPAFESAIAKGADAVEFDVHLTKDNQLVIHHDDYLGRIERASGHVGSHTLAELQSLDVGSWFDHRFKGAKMPTLDDVLARGNDKTRFEIELRTPTLPFLMMVINAIVFRQMEERVELTSPHLPLLFHVKKTNEQLRTGLFFEPFPAWVQSVQRNEQIINWLLLSGAEVAHLPNSLIEEDLVKGLHERGLLLHGADLNSEEDIRRGLKMRIDQFSTDNLDLALSVRRNMEYRQ